MLLLGFWGFGDVVRNWPVLDLGDVPDISTDEWTLEVGGLVENPGHAHLEGLPRAAAGGRRQRLSLRDDVEPLRQPLEGRAVSHDRGARRASARCAPRPDDRLRPHAGHAHSLHDERAARARDRRGRAAGAHVAGTTLAARTRRAGADDHAEAVRLEGREVDSPRRFPRARIRRGSGSCAGTRTPRSRGPTIGTAADGGAEAPPYCVLMCRAEAPPYCRIRRIRLLNSSTMVGPRDDPRVPC